MGPIAIPRRIWRPTIALKDMNEAVLFNMRNAYQNYNVAVNLSDRVIYTYMGVLQPKMGNANYCSAGQLSPLLNDPLYRTIGLGTRIFLGGGVGYVVGNGTQHNPGVKRTEAGVPKTPAGTLSVYRRPETDESGLASRHFLYGLRGDPHGGHWCSHPHFGRGDSEIDHGSG